MTSKQKANAMRFKKAIAEAKKLRKKNPKLTQAQAVKQAWAILYKGGKVTGTKTKKVSKKTTKKKASKRAVRKVTGTHTDKQSHNVRINVVSGLTKISGFANKAKYYIDYKLNGYKKIEYFDKLPKDKYKGSDRIIYVTRLTDDGTSLIPLKNFKTNKFLKK